MHMEDRLVALHRTLSDRGAKTRGQPVAVSWEKDTMQFEVEDLDGNLLVFWGSPESC